MKQVKERARGIVRSNREVAPEHRVVRIELPRTFAVATPGQFVMIRTPGADSPLLPRPFSIYSRDEGEGTQWIDLLYRVVGEGTQQLASRGNGDGIDVLGPLGKGFRIDPGLRRMVLVAGGAGVAPLNFLAEYCRRNDVDREREIWAYLGARTAGLLAGLDRIEAVCDRVLVATDDGSRGCRGMVTDCFRNDLPSLARDGSDVYACGPGPMMKTLAELSERAGLQCQVSVEERMACGFGVCRGCAVKVRPADPEPRYRPVCTDGPVFDARDIDWDDS
ncbi:MAG: dihydroorotate dehydrogenase electron transfer subunit [Syntrophales bacterium]|jgi:dihydroorotate dehydrogenase electron transfer subunit|nr:dihydroorotate dehydrogenase electron transfer subunit [Syntrophales bacterium]MCK9528344.1 dihydroorotate dehydrogenase electron transfer subunit [Syntrophales bacterium]MDX9922183.1 dihydroorotate dehydrogenase electron transfer subunit [Syntrophales bacterium]